jgi:predicted acyl esterase
VQLQVRHVGERYVPRAETQWPLAGTRWTRLYLRADELGLADSPAVQESSVRYAPLGDGVTFRAPAWERDVEITGPLAAKLWVSSATVDADLFLVVRLFDRDGAEVLFQGTVDPRTPIAQGWLRASHRTLDPRLSQPWRPYHSHDGSESLQPGEVYELDIEIWPTCIVVPAGHQLALTVRGSDFDHGLEGVPVGDTGYVMRGCAIFFHDDPTDRSPDVFGGDVTLNTGGDTPSHLLVPVIPSSRT